MLLLAVVNVDLRFAHTGVGYGLRQCFAVGRKLPFICLGSLAFQLVNKYIPRVAIESEVRSLRSNVRDQTSDIRHQKSEWEKAGVASIFSLTGRLNR